MPEGFDIVVGNGSDELISLLAMACGFTLLFEALILAMCRQMPFAAVARLVGESWHRVVAICDRYVELALEKADLSKLTMLAVDETSCRRGHNYLTFAADAAAHKVVFVTEGRDAGTICAFSQFLLGHKGTPEQIACVSIDMSPAFIKGVTKYLPNARITFDKFHIVAHASKAVDETRRSEQKTDPSLKGLRWALLKDRQRLGESQRADLDAFVAQATTKRTARAWLYREQLREILDRKQINVVSAMLKRWCANVRRSKVEAMKKVAQMILDHFEGVAAWAQTRQTNGFLEAINGLSSSGAAALVVVVPPTIAKTFSPSPVLPGVVVNGTTGESSTLTSDESIEMVRRVKDRATRDV